VPPRRALLLALAGLYLAGIWLDAVGLTRITQVLPGPLRFFTQVARLFPQAKDMTIEYRAEGYRCATGKFVELDLRPHFPIRADDKENRFDRAMYFYHEEKRVLAALDGFIVRRESALGPERRIGGVLLMSLRIPVPEPGTPEERYHRVPLDELPRTIERKYWYTTSPEAREKACRTPRTEADRGAAAGGPAAGGGETPRRSEQAVEK
jgi:hypothetical protein